MSEATEENLSSLDKLQQEAEPTKPDIFLLYSQEDRELAFDLKKFLLELCPDICIVDDEQDYTTSFQKIIKKIIKASKIFVFITENLLNNFFLLRIIESVLTLSLTSEMYRNCIVPVLSNKILKAPFGLNCLNKINIEEIKNVPYRKKQLIQSLQKIVRTRAITNRHAS